LGVALLIQVEREESLDIVISVGKKYFLEKNIIAQPAARRFLVVVVENVVVVVRSEVKTYPKDQKLEKKCE
jgi:hypothetical protein